MRLPRNAAQRPAAAAQAPISGNAEASPVFGLAVEFAAAVVELGMIARNSDYVGSATLDSVQQLLDGMELNDERAGFRDLVELAKNGTPVVEDGGPGDA